MGFEGGQMPLIRRIPKRGFNCDKSVAYQVVSIEKLVKYFGAKEAVIDAEKMKAKGLIKKVDGPVKILGDGEVAEAVTVKATAFSKSAKGKIEKAGGKAEIVRFAD
jgi:large subunit ribosomal protein L15